MTLVVGNGFPNSSTDIVKVVSLSVDHLGYYWALSLEPGSSISDVKRRYRKLARVFHPDGSEPDRDAFLFLQEIYSTLGDPVEKREYDLARGKETFKPKDEEERQLFERFISDKIDGWSFVGEKEDSTYAQWAYKELLRLSYRDGISYTWRVTVTKKGFLVKIAPVVGGVYICLPLGADVDLHWREIKSLLRSIGEPI